MFFTDIYYSFLLTMSDCFITETDYLDFDNEPISDIGRAVQRNSELRYCNIRSRRWCFTIFSDLADLRRYIEELASKWITANVQFAMQIEKCPASGKLHLQGCISFAHGKSLSTVKLFLGCYHAHCEPCKDWNKSIDYCQKVESRFVDTDGETYSAAHYKKYEVITDVTGFAVYLNR